MYNAENFKSYISRNLEKDRIGVIINHTTHIKDILYSGKIQELYPNETDTPEKLKKFRTKLTEYLICLTTTSEMEIDKAKTGEAPPIEKRWEVGYAPSWKVTESNKLKIYESNSLLGILSRKVKEFYKEYMLEDNYPQIYDFSRDMVAYCSIDYDLVKTLTPIIDRIRKNYNSEIKSIMTNISDNDLRRQAIGATIDKFSDEVRGLHYDVKTLAYVAYISCSKVTNNKGRTATTSFAWNCTFEGLLLLLEEITAKNSNKTASMLFPIKSATRFNGDTVEIVNGQANNLKLPLSDGTYELFTDSYTNKQYLVVNYQVSKALDCDRDLFRVKLNTKYTGFSIEKAKDILSSNKVTFGSVSQNGGTYTGCLVDDVLVANVMKAESRKNIIGFSILEESLIKYATTYDMEFVQSFDETGTYFIGEFKILSDSVKESLQTKYDESVKVLDREELEQFRDAVDSEEYMDYLEQQVDYDFEDEVDFDIDEADFEAYASEVELS